jgi:hypothetical protein
MGHNRLSVAQKAPHEVAFIQADDLRPLAAFDLGISDRVEDPPDRRFVATGAETAAVATFLNDCLQILGQRGDVINFALRPVAALGGEAPIVLFARGQSSRVISYLNALSSER